MSLQIEKQRNRRKEKSKYKIRTRIDHKPCIVETEDYGSFKQMYQKYGDKVAFFCADVWNELGEPSCRLDSDEYDNHTQYSLKKYGRHKAWISDLYFGKKKVVLVFNAQLDTVVGTTGTIIGGAVALSTAQRLLKEKRRRRAIAIAKNKKKRQRKRRR